MTIVDALEAGELENFGPVPERGVFAAGTGADLLLFSTKDISESISGSEAFEAALKDGGRSTVRSTSSRPSGC